MSNKIAPGLCPNKKIIHFVAHTIKLNDHEHIWQVAREALVLSQLATYRPS